MDSRRGQARLTGTGSCVFAGFDDARDARAVLARLPENMSGFVARGLNASPLIEMGHRTDSNEK